MYFVGNFYISSSSSVSYLKESLRKHTFLGFLAVHQMYFMIIFLNYIVEYSWLLWLTFDLVNFYWDSVKYKDQNNLNLYFFYVFKINANTKDRLF